MGRTPHTSAPRGKRIHVTLKDGTKFIDKFIERTPNHVVFENRRVWAGDIKAFKIYKEINHEKIY